MPFVQSTYRLVHSRPPEPSATGRALLRLLAGALVGLWLLGNACLPNPQPGPRIGLYSAAIVPASGATVPTPPTAVRAYTNFDLDPAGVEGGWLRVAIGGAQVAGTVVADEASTNGLVFTPTAPLPFGVIVEVVVSGNVRGRNGQVLGNDRSFSFAIDEAGPGSLRLGTTTQLQAGPERLVLAPPARTSPQEIALAWRTPDPPATYAASFWDQSAGSWSLPTSTTGALAIGSTERVATVTDGAGGLLLVSDGLAVHHARSLTTQVFEQAEAFHLQRVEPGPTRIWSRQPLAAGVGVASSDWDTGGSTCLPNLAGASQSGLPSDTTFVPDGADGAQWLQGRAVTGSTTLFEIVARPRDRFGVDGTERVLAQVPSGTVLLATAVIDGRALLLWSRPLGFARELVAIESVPGLGWLPPVTLLATGSDLTRVAVTAALSSDGAAVVAVAETGTSGGLRLMSRSASGSFSAPEEVGLVGFAPQGTRAAVTEAGDGLVSLSFGGGDVVLLGRRAAGPWSQPLSLQQVAQLPTTPLSGVADVRLAGVAAGRFLMAQVVLLPGVQFVLQALEVSVQ